MTKTEECPKCKAAKAWDKTHKAYNKACKAYDKVFKAYVKAEHSKECKKK